MKNFFKMVFATMLGFILLQVLAFIIMLFIIAGMAASIGKKATPVKANSVLCLELNGTLSERVAEDPFEGLYGENKSNMALNDVLESIKHAKNDDNIKGISIEVNSLIASLASLEEIRNALSDFKKSGKFIYAYGENYTQGQYYLTSVADKVFVHPEGTFDMHGLSMQVMFYKQLLEKLDVDMQIVKVGTYKSAVEPFVLDHMSDANKEQISALLVSEWNHILNQISASRGISVEQINADCDALSLFSNLQYAKEKGYIDSTIYQDEYTSYLKKQLGLDKKEDISYITPKQYASSAITPSNAKNIIGVVYATGNIIDGEGDNGTIGRNIADQIADLAEEDNVKAIVLRINSGGGSALMSENIWREIVRLKKQKPIVVSMSDVAASGGYYIACAADYIVAQPTTITGSIGVFGMIPNVQGLMKKIGVSIDEVSTNKHASLLGINRPMDGEEREVMQQFVNKTYSTFLTRVSDGRNIATTYVDSVGQGRIWSGEDALKLHLVDTLGGIDVAINKAAQLAKISSYRIESYPHMKNVWEEFAESMMNKTMLLSKQRAELGDMYMYFNYLQNSVQMNGVQAIIPFEFSIK